MSIRNKSCALSKKISSARGKTIDLLKGSINIKLFWAASLLLILSSEEIQAANFRINSKETLHSISISGPIIEGDFDQFLLKLKQTIKKSSRDKKIIIIDINSQGGLIIEAKKIASIIRDAKVPILVPRYAECASACFIIFLSSPYKMAAHGSRIGVHSASLKDGEENSFTKETTIEFARYAKASGAPDSVVGKIVSTKPTDIIFLSDNELRSMGVAFIDEDKFENNNAYQPPSQTSNNWSSQSNNSTYSVTTQNQHYPSNNTEGNFIDEQDRNFQKYWGQIIGWSKAQHSGKIAVEKRCNNQSCAAVIAYYDRKQRYVEAWRFNDEPYSRGKKYVCRQNERINQLTCTDWYDGHEFYVNYTHQIGASLITQEDDLFDIFR